MLAQDAPGTVHDGTGPKGLGDARHEKAPIVVVGDEADLLALGLFGHRQCAALGLGADLFLGEPTYRKQGVGQLVLPQHVEGVGLVLAGVAASAQLVARVCAQHACVMAGG